MKSGLVIECAVVGIDDSEGLLGTVPALVYVPAKKSGEAEILAYLSEHLEAYKVPARCLELGALPRNYMGKLERQKIRDLFETA